ISDPRPYDDTGWTLGALRNVKTTRVTDASILKAPMTLLNGPVHAEGKITGNTSAGAYIINHNAENTLATFRFRLHDVKMNAAEESFKAGGQDFRAGSFIIRAQDAARDSIEPAARELGLKVSAV